MKHDIILVYIQNLKTDSESKFLLKVLDGLFLLLKKGEKFFNEENLILKNFEENNGFLILEELQKNHPKTIIFKKISSIIDYFYDEKPEIYEGDEEEKQ